MQASEKAWKGKLQGAKEGVVFLLFGLWYSSGSKMEAFDQIDLQGFSIL